jgi:transcription elongation factor GreA
MQVPQRRSQAMRHQDDQEDIATLTEAGFERLKNEIARLKQQHPQAVEALRTAKDLGDLSENAEYQEAKGRLARLNERLVLLTNRLQKAVVITGGASPSGRARLGSTVTVRVNGKEKTYELVGPNEANLERGRLSHLSPLGSVLVNAGIGETVTVQAPAGPIQYEIVKIV